MPVIIKALKDFSYRQLYCIVQCKILNLKISYIFQEIERLYCIDYDRRI